MMMSDARHTHSLGKKHSHVLDPVEGYEAGVDRTQGSMGGRISLPASWQGLAGKAGYCLSCPSHRCFHPWVLLACPLLPKGKDSHAKQPLLAGKIRREPGPGPAKCPASSPRRVVGPDRLGVFPVDSQVTGQVHPQVVECLSQEASKQAVDGWHNTVESASIHPRGTVTLEADRRRPGDASGDKRLPCAFRVLAENFSSPSMDNSPVPVRPTFIDLFSGCGGLSLGLSQAGWQGLFAIERATDAFETFRANFLGEGSRHRFQWPAWLEQAAHSIDDILKDHHGELNKLRNKVDLIAGGPPCQGFSFAGKRNSSDPRNKMFQRYVSFVEIINPKFLVLENVPGMNVAHTERGNKTARAGQTYYDKLHDALGMLGYTVGPMILDAANFGVPQRRTRLVVIGIRSDMIKKFSAGCTGLFDAIDIEGAQQLSELGGGKPVTAQQAISDLVVGTGKPPGQRTIEYIGFGARNGYVQLKYEGPHGTSYQQLMNAGVARDQMDSMRLARHREDVRVRFQKILATSRRGVSLSSDDRERFGMLKHRTVPMSPTQPAPTLTTLPDDILHYRDPRILTVRECARLQSFPDWFTFHGKYTTGGDRRKVECPRYTQVGNAVPPLLAKAIGSGILAAWKSVDAKSKGNSENKTITKKHATLAMC
jgi:DNA (cytosine-5)-methyltransferase 1